jgi:protein farnesyltransferase subunit beta
MVVITDVNQSYNNNNIDSFQLEQQQQQSLLYTRTTASTEQQIQTELECTPYLNLLQIQNTHRNAATTPNEHIEYFKSRGVIVDVSREQQQQEHQQQSEDTDELQNAETAQPHSKCDYFVRLLREQHTQYLNTIFLDSVSHKLRPSFTSLDSSHPWMIYWCLHGLDIMGKLTGNDHHFIQRIVSTLQACYTKCTVSISRDIVTSDSILRNILEKTQLKDPSDIVVIESLSTQGSQRMVQFDNVGGFGGGPGQLPHAATTYAAIMSLCILASSSASSAAAPAKTHVDRSNLALQYLQSIRTSLYVWFVSLYNPINGSFRMHMDGELDVRATYCIYAVLNLLQMIPKASSSSSTTTTVTSTKTSLFTTPLIADYIWSCQSIWEGGFGGEPGAEAHGGYTYCAISALCLFYKNAESKLTNKIGNQYKDRMKLCTSWLVHRQMSYEGGFSGRINKLVDGCYSFWQCAALSLLQDLIRQLKAMNHIDDENSVAFIDPWIYPVRTLSSPAVTTTLGNRHDGNTQKSSLTIQDHSFVDATMLERYILLCTQDENGGLRDKPSKGRDFYHSCYCLSGLSMAQHYGGHIGVPSESDGDIENTSTFPTHPCYNVRIEHAAFCLSYIAEDSAGNNSTL